MTPCPCMAKSYDSPITTRSDQNYAWECVSELELSRCIFRDLATGARSHYLEKIKNKKKRLKGITGFHYMALELESEANLHKPSLYYHRAQAF